MANATNALSRIGIIKESVLGTTPATPTLESQRFSSTNFSVERSELEDTSKANTRQKLYVKTGNKTVNGSLSGPLAHNNYDVLLESVMFNEWDTNVLKLGDTLVSMTVEENASDITQYKINRGVVANSMTVTSPADGLSTISFDFLGMSQEMSGTSVSASPYTAQAVRQPMTHCGGTINEGGTAIGIVTEIDFTISNNLSSQFVWGDCDPSDIIEGRVDVTGTMSVLFSDAALYNKFMDDTSTSIDFELDDGDGNTIKFDMPNVRYTGADMPIDEGSGPRIITLPFRAVYDASEESTLVITRSA